VLIAPSFVSVVLGADAHATVLQASELHAAVAAEHMQVKKNVRELNRLALGKLRRVMVGGKSPLVTPEVEADLKVIQARAQHEMKKGNHASANIVIPLGATRSYGVSPKGNFAYYANDTLSWREAPRSAKTNQLIAPEEVVRSIHEVAENVRAGKDVELKNVLPK
jgi:hypothetical protein